MYQSPAQGCHFKQFQSVSFTEYNCEIEMMDPSWSGRDEYVYQEGERVKPVQEEVKELSVCPAKHVVLHHVGVERYPVHQRDEQRHSGAHVLQYPGQPATWQSMTFFPCSRSLSLLVKEGKVPAVGGAPVGQRVENDNEGVENVVEGEQSDSLDTESTIL